MVFNSCAVISASRLDFIGEPAKPKFSAIMPDMDGPFASLLIEMNADEARRGIFSFTPVVHILLMRGEAEIVPTIIEGITVSMVNQKCGRRVHQLTVHKYYFRFKRAGQCATGRIQIGPISVDPPFEMPKTVVILRVKDCPLPLAEENAAKSIAITEKAIGEQGTGENKVEPVRNFDLNSCHNILSSLATEQVFF
jgi:hypothetical protein